MERDKVIEAVRKLPQEFDLEQLMEKLIFIEKVEQGLKKLDVGKTTDHAQVKEMVKVVWTAQEQIGKLGKAKMGGMINSFRYPLP